MVLQERAQGGEKRCPPTNTVPLNALPSCFISPTINHSPFQGVFCVTFFEVLYFLPMMSVVPKHSAEVLLRDHEHKKAAGCLREQTQLLGKLHSGMGYT